MSLYALVGSPFPQWNAGHGIVFTDHRGTGCVAQDQTRKEIKAFELFVRKVETQKKKIYPNKWGKMF